MIKRLKRAWEAFNTETKTESDYRTIVIFENHTFEPQILKIERKLPNSFSIVEAVEKIKKDLIQQLIKTEGVFDIVIDHESCNEGYKKLTAKLIVWRNE